MSDFFLLRAFKWTGALLAGFWGQMAFMVQGLAILMVVDIFVGLISAGIKGTISSDIAWKGMGKKTVALILVAVCYLITSHWSVYLGFRLGAFAAAFYCIHELISITENAFSCGVPVPPPLVKIIRTAKQELETLESKEKEVLDASSRRN